MKITGMIREPPRSATAAWGSTKTARKASFWLKWANSQESLPLWAAYHHEGHESSLPCAAANHEYHESFLPWAAINHEGHDNQ